MNQRMSVNIEALSYIMAMIMALIMPMSIFVAKLRIL
jgi:hypothetical protein|tara:strand:- start:3366 stop:3476 length:111 start_codon:yes stop_codon:yes gene_type:complete